MKKGLIYGTMAVVCVTGIFTLTGCSKDEQIVKESENEEIGFVEESRPTEIILSEATDAWPAGVYDYYGIPAYKSGTVIYASPKSETGRVYIRTTADELVKYLNDLEKTGIRVHTKTKTDSYQSYNLYDKNPGKGFYVVVDFEEKTEFLGGSDVTYNLYFSIVEEQYPEKNIQKDILLDYGFKDEDIIPKNVEIFNAELQNYGSQKRVEFRPGFDVSVTEDDNKAYHAQIVDACARISDDGNLENLEGEKVTPQKIKDDFTNVWKFTTGGKTYKINFTIQSGVGVTYNFVIQ